MREFGASLLVAVCFQLCVSLSEAYTDGQCQLSISINGKSINASDVEKGSDLIVTCSHNLTGGSISWKVNNELKTEQTTEKYEISYIKVDTNITCNVTAAKDTVSCNITIILKEPNHMVVILVCVGGAAAVLILFAVVMKISLKRGRARTQARTRQRQQNMDNIHSTVSNVNTVSSYY